MPLILQEILSYGKHMAVKTKLCCIYVG